jgi:CheY-like chemotaxis protein
MTEICWDIKRGTSVYLQVSSSHLKNWIRTGKIKTGEVVVWHANLSGWRKPEELAELIPFFELYEKSISGKRARRKAASRPVAAKKQVTSILLVDDEKELCALLGDSLRAQGFQMEFAHSRRAALKSLKTNAPDLVLLDLKLPDGDGMSLLARIRKMFPATAVIITTAYGSEEARNKAIKLGAHDFLDKPYNEEDVILRINKMPVKAKRGVC